MSGLIRVVDVVAVAVLGVLAVVGLMHVSAEALNRNARVRIEAEDGSCAPFCMSRGFAVSRSDVDAAPGAIRCVCRDAR